VPVAPSETRHEQLERRVTRSTTLRRRSSPTRPASDVAGPSVPSARLEKAAPSCPGRLSLLPSPPSPEKKKAKSASARGVENVPAAVSEPFSSVAAKMTDPDSIALGYWLEARLANMENNMSARINALAKVVESSQGQSLPLLRQLGRDVNATKEFAEEASHSKRASVHRRELLSTLGTPWSRPSQVDAACADGEKSEAIEEFCSRYVERPPRMIESFFGQLFTEQLLGSYMVKTGG